MDKLLTISECVPIARCSYSKLYKLAKSGALPFRKLGATWLIPESRLLEALGLEAAATSNGKKKGR